MLDANHKRVQGVMLPPSGSKPLGEADEVRLVDRVENLYHSALDNLVLHGGDAEGALPPIRLWDLDTPRRLCPVGPPMNAGFQVAKAILQTLSVGIPRHPVHTRRRVPLQPVIGLLKQRCVDVMQQGGEPLRFSRRNA